jgi:hypothetical protein
VLPPQLVRGQVVALVHPKARQNTLIILLVFFITVQGLKRIYGRGLRFFAVVSLAPTPPPPPQLSVLETNGGD